MNFELSSPNLQDLEQIVTTLIVDAKCACHVINPHKTRILLWKEIKKEGTVVYHLRIGIQKFTSQEQTDRNGETYWRMYNAEVKKKESQPASLKEKVNKEDNQTQTQPINHGKSDDIEPAINSSTS